MGSKELNDEFILYKAKHLRDISHEYINNKETKCLYDFIAKRFYNLFKYAQSEHNKFFWLLLDEEEDYEHYSSQARAWGIPIYDFETDKKTIFKRVVQGLKFVRLRGTQKQVEDILSIIFAGRTNWTYISTYTEDKGNRISIIVRDLVDLKKPPEERVSHEERRQYALKYLHEVIPPYISIEIKKFTLKNKDLFGKVLTYDDILEKGGSSFIKKNLATEEHGELISDCIMLPEEAFRIGKSKLGEDVVKRINKRNNKDLKTIILFIKKEFMIARGILKDIIEQFFHENEIKDIFVFSEDDRATFGKWNQIR